MSDTEAADVPRHRRSPILLGICLLLASCAAPPPAPIDQETRNLRAFAKLYGHIRWFHPSDEAAAIDWNRFAVYGAQRVRGAPDAHALHRSLVTLFAPIAPTLRIHDDQESAVVIPACATGPTGRVAWQHLGAYLGPGSSELYRSHRLGRETALYYSADGNFGAWLQRVDVERFRGQQFRIRAAIRTAVDARGSHAQMAYKFHGGGDRRDVRGPRIESTRWTEAGLAGVVPDDAKTITFGAYLLGAGSAWLDDFSLEVGDGNGWRPVAIANPGFETDAGWLNFGIGDYQYAIVDRQPAEGARSAEIHAEHAGVVIDEPLFAARPGPDETVTVALGDGLAATYPLTLPERDGATCPSAKEAAREVLDAALARVEMEPTSAAVRHAAVIVAWNAFQHFHPYFDLVDVDWNRELTLALRSARDDVDAHDLLVTLRNMLAATRDGHATVRHAVTTTVAPLPFATAMVEGEVVVTASSHGSVRPGDVVRRIDGVDARTVQEAATRSFAGSPQLVDAWATRAFAEGPLGSRAEVELSRGGRASHATVTRGGRQATPVPLHDPVAEVRDGIWYIDLARPFDDALAANLDAVTGARGVIIDVRGYPTGDAFGVLRRLSTESMRTGRFLAPEIIYPDFRSVTFRDTGRVLEPATPRFAGTAVFLTAGGAMSAAETVMGIVDAHDLGEIVGGPTAGVNGNVNRIDLPGGFDLMFTGTRVVKHDGSRHHLVGIQPTVPLEPTIAGIREGRDEYIEKAVEIIEAADRPSGSDTEGGGGGASTASVSDTEGRLEKGRVRD